MQASVVGDVALPPVYREQRMTDRKRENLKVVAAPSAGHAVSAPPVLIASTHTVDYCCGHCSTVLLHAEPAQVFNLLIRCTACGHYNVTEA